MTPEDLYSASGYSDLRSLALLRRCVQLADARVISEQGTYRGASAAVMALTSSSVIVYTIDNGSFGVSEEEVHENLRAVGASNVVVMRGESNSMGDHLLPLESRPVDLAFIDADHTYEAARADFDSIYPLMHKRSVLVLDDLYLPLPDDVSRLYLEISDLFAASAEFPFHRGVAVLGPLNFIKELEKCEF